MYREGFSISNCMTTKWGKLKALPYWLKVNLKKLVELYIKVSIKLQPFTKVSFKPKSEVVSLS